MDIVAELLSRGADPCITSRNEGWDALQWATNTPGSAGDREGVIKLLEEWRRGSTTAVEEWLVVKEPAERGEQPGTALGGGGGSSLADKLCELQTARDEELLTESEFQAARQNAIASLIEA